MFAPATRTNAQPQSGLETGVLATKFTSDGDPALLLEGAIFAINNGVRQMTVKTLLACRNRENDRNQETRNPR